MTEMTSDDGRDSDNGHRNDFVIYMIAAGVIGLENHPNKEKFINGLQDIPLDELYVDSLTYIQIAIQIEEKYGLSMSPDDISKFATLSDLVETTLEIR
jgi:acyl carrier protein